MPFGQHQASAVKPEVLKSWCLDIDYSRAPCLGADQKTRRLWERDWSQIAVWSLERMRHLCMRTAHEIYRSCRREKLAQNLGG